MTVTIPKQTIVTPLYKKYFLDWHFNNDQIYSNSGSTIDIWLGLSWNDPTDWQNELTNYNNDNREWWFRTWEHVNFEGVNPRPRQGSLPNKFEIDSLDVYDEFQQIGAITGGFPGGWPTSTGGSPGWVPPFDGYYSVDNAGNTSPNNVYAAPSHILYLNAGSHPTSQSQYDAQLLVAVPIINHQYDPPLSGAPNWISSEVYFDINETDHAQGDVMRPYDTIISWRPEDY